MQVHIKTPTGHIIRIGTNPHEKIEKVKELIQQADASYKIDEFKLSFCGQSMDEARSLTDFKVQHESVLQMVRCHDIETLTISFTLFLFLCFSYVDVYQTTGKVASFNKIMVSKFKHLSRMNRLV